MYQFIDADVLAEVRPLVSGKVTDFKETGKKREKVRYKERDLE